MLSKCAKRHARSFNIAIKTLGSLTDVDVIQSVLTYCRFFISILWEWEKKVVGTRKWVSSVICFGSYVFQHGESFMYANNPPSRNPLLVVAMGITPASTNFAWSFYLPRSISFSSSSPSFHFLRYEIPAGNLKGWLCVIPERPR